MCSRDMYANVGDFGWYLDVLVQLIRYAPTASTSPLGDEGDEVEEEGQEENDKQDVGEAIGKELRNVAVRVRSVRGEAARYAEMLVGKREGMFPAAGGGGRRVLGAAGWIVGEYAGLLTEPNETLSALLHPSSSLLPADILAIYIQAVPKIYSVLAGAENAPWAPPRKSAVALLTSKIIKFLEPLAISPNLEVQERAVEFLELFRLAAEAVAQQPATTEDADEQYDAPLLITQVIPGMFLGFELNPVAPRAQRKVPLPAGLDLDEPINPYLQQLLLESEKDSCFAGEDEDDGFREWYYQKAIPKQASIPASLGIDSAALKNLSAVASYQSGDMKEENYLDKDILERRKRERRERNKDDPFYIGSTVVSGGDEEVDLDSIPVMKLDLGDSRVPTTPHPQPRTSQPKKQREKVVIAADEGIENEGDESSTEEVIEISKRKSRKGLLQVDSSGLMGYSLDEPSDSAARQEEDVRVARKEVEKFRAEMERAAERVRARISTEEPKEKKKKKKKKGEGGDGERKKKKKKTGDAREGVGGKAKKKLKRGKEDQGEAAEA